MSLLPSSPEVSVEENPRVVGLDSDEADALMRALSSDTAREMLSALHEEPLPPSKLADEVDTTLQNAQYHLERLSDAGAIDVVGTAYSEKGREMDVYAPADKPLVIFAGRDDQASGIRAALRRLVGGLAALLFGAVAVQEVFGRGLGQLAPSLFGTGAGGGDGGGAAGDGGAAATATATPTDSPTPEATPSRTPPPETTSGGGDVGIFDTGGTETATTAADEGGAGGGAGGATAEPSATSTPAGTPTQTAEPTLETVTEAPEATASATQTAADGAIESTATATPTPTSMNETVTETARTATEAAAGGEAALGLPPGLIFFLGGAVVLGVAVALTYR